MKSYGQFCPVAKAAELFCERWTALILRDLATGATRFSELRRGVPLMSPTLLSRRLRQLEAEGVVERRRAKGARHATYHLTRAGAEFVPLVEALGVWGQRWTRRDLQEGEVDLTLLLWSIERNVRPDVFDAPRTVVELELRDQASSRRRWWFVNEGGVCDVCLEDPGFEVDLYLSATLADAARLVRGDVSFSRAVESGRLRVVGRAAARRRLRAWLNLSPLTRVRSQRRDAVG